MPITIEAAQPSDLPDLIALLHTCDLPPEGIEAHLETALLARSAEGLAGSAALECYGDTVLLRSVAVDPAFRRRGLARQLVQASLALARTQGARRAVLLTTTAAGFFRRLGFQPVARSDVSAALAGSIQFNSVCPDSADVLARDLLP
jgi:amino-acid N-acetyltransferase